MEGITRASGEIIEMIADAAYSDGDIVQVRDGRAGVVRGDVASGALMSVEVTRGLVVEMPKTTSMLILIGSQLYWDHSANKVHLLHGNDRDFPVGVAVGGGPTHITSATSAGVSGPSIAATAAGTVVNVALNERPVYTAGLEHGFQTLPVATAGISQGVVGHNQGASLILDATAEAQKMDAFGRRGFAPGALTIVDALICVNDGGTTSNLDVNIGIASNTNATDADSILESLFVHIDGNNTNINIESDDNTTEVAATNTTVAYTAGTPFLAQFDLTNTSDIQAYINGVNVLPSSVFKLNAAAGPLYPLAHVEKTSNNTTANITVMLLGARSSQV